MDKLEKMDKPQQRLHRPQSCGGLLWALTPSDGAASPTISKWTPPLSPTGSGNRSSKRTTSSRPGIDPENRPSAADAVAMLKQSGVPALEGVRLLRHMVGAAPRAWVRDFKIRGGRSVRLLFTTSSCSRTAVRLLVQFLVYTTFYALYSWISAAAGTYRIPQDLDWFVLARFVSFRIISYPWSVQTQEPGQRYQRTRL